MFNKRLIQELSEAKIYVIKQVVYQWIALLMNILFTIGICYVFYSLIQNTLTFSILTILLLISILLFLIRGYALKKAHENPRTVFP